MARRKAVYPLEQWAREVSERLPHLSAPEAAVLAAWSFGMVLAHSCSLTAVAGVLAALLGVKTNTERQRLREFCYPAHRKRGAHRQAVAVGPCFAPLLAWVLDRWPGDHVLLGLDATTLGERFVVLAISVLYRGCAIPVAWAIVPAGQKGAWRPVWERLLGALRAGVPRRDLAVLVLADRGLYAKWLFRAMLAQHWHPFLRVNTGGTFRPAGWHAFHPLRQFVPAPGRQWQGTGVAFSTARLPCTLLARWEAGHRDPWLLLTDLAPEEADAGWYGLRQWIERGFCATKRGGWQWQQTKMTDPDRAERLWLAIAVATLWLLAVGGEAEAAAADAALANLAVGARRQHHRQQPRLTGVFRRGWSRLLTALLTAAPLPLGAFLPEPLPHRAPLSTTDFLDEPSEQAA
jgi:hypothetical protein